MGVAFVIANPAIFSPKVWNYLNAYSGERLLTHTGYLMGDQPVQEQHFALAVLGHPGLLLPSVSRDQSSFGGAGDVDYRVHREPPSLAQAQLWFCLVHDPVLDRSLLADGRKVAAIFTFASAFPLHGGGSRNCVSDSLGVVRVPKMECERRRDRGGDGLAVAPGGDCAGHSRRTPARRITRFTQT